MGLSDAHDSYVKWGDMEPHFCAAGTIKLDQLRKIVVKYLNDHPENLHLAGGNLVTNALHYAFLPSEKYNDTRYCPDGGENDE